MATNRYNRRWVMVDGVRVTVDDLLPPGALEMVRFCLGEMRARPKHLTIQFNSQRRAPRRYGTFIWRALVPDTGRVYIYTRYQFALTVIDTIAHELAHAEDYALGTLATLPANRAARGIPSTPALRRAAHAAAERYANQRATEWVTRAGFRRPAGTRPSRYRVLVEPQGVDPHAIHLDP